MNPTASFSLADRVVVFIDGSNVHHAVKRRQALSPGFQVDYSRLVGRLSEGYRLVRAYFYGSRPPSLNPAQEKFFKRLGHQGIQTRIFTLKNRGGKLIEKGVDVALVTDLISLANKDAYDTAIIVSGDRDYVNAILNVMDLGKRVVIAAFDDNISGEQQTTGDAYINLSQPETLSQIAQTT